jgi:hypothetical protein
MQSTARRPKTMVSADGKGIVSQAGALLTDTARVTRLQVGLPAGLARWWPGRAVHGLGKMVLDLAVAVALGGGCLADAWSRAADITAAIRLQALAPGQPGHRIPAAWKEKPGTC